MCSLLQMIPNEILNLTILELKPREILRLSQMSKYFRYIVHDENLWKKLVARDFSDEKKKETWFETYKRAHKPKYLFYTRYDCSPLSWIPGPVEEEARKELEETGFFIQSNFPYVYLVGDPYLVEQDISEFTSIESETPLEPLEVAKRVYSKYLEVPFTEYDIEEAAEEGKEPSKVGFEEYLGLLGSENYSIQRCFNGYKFGEADSRGDIYYVDNLEPCIVQKTKYGFYVVPESEVSDEETP